jgi:predicted cupin superfamily sugar epimerase
VKLHRIRNDQLYHYYLGDPLEVFLLHADGGTERVIGWLIDELGSKPIKLLSGESLSDSVLARSTEDAKQLVLAER